jgi:pimeloyl-ACP methyl ester carboxylesterase
MSSGLIAVIVFIVVIAGVFLFYITGSKPAVDTRVNFHPLAISNDLDVYLAKTEAQYPDVRPHQHKQIIWADRTNRTVTPHAIIYIHGFSASSSEIRPVPEDVAAGLNANIYFTRLTGHGRSSEAMIEGNISAWLKDFAEALAIGERIGREIIVIATSTGASLVTYALTRPEFRKRISKVVFVSPNYGIQGRGAFLLTGPHAQRIAHFLLGKERSFSPQNKFQAQHWTTSYPTAALLPMAALVKLAKTAKLESIKAPALIFLSHKDKVVDPSETMKVAKRWGAGAEIIEVEGSGDPFNHVLAGDILSPQTSEFLISTILAWLQGNLNR